jgi:hypothetical protein
MEDEMDATEQVWRRDFENASAAIKPEWLVHLDDGFVGIAPEYRQYPQVTMYANLCQVGYARGWMI